jgi:hypothetical protein
MSSRLQVCKNLAKPVGTAFAITRPAIFCAQWQWATNSSSITPAARSRASRASLDKKSHYFDAKASQDKNPWSAIDVAFVEAFPKVLSLGYLKQQTALEQLPLVQKGSRLSVMPVTAEQWAAVLALR